MNTTDHRGGTPLLEWSAELRGADDIELGIVRSEMLTYRACAPADQEAVGVALVIADLGELALAEQLPALRRHLARVYGLLAVTVEYQCSRSSLADGAQIELQPAEFAALGSVCAKHGVALLDRRAILHALGNLPVAYEFQMRVSPPKGAYQNLGLVAALDHLKVLADLGRQDRWAPALSRVVALGGGFGGYLAHLLAKLAPNTIGAVFDYAAPPAPPVSWLFGGDSKDAAPFYIHVGKVRLFPLLKTRWSPDPFSQSYYSPARSILRDTMHPPHLHSMRQATMRPCCYRIAKPVERWDQFAQRKIEQIAGLQAAGFDASLCELALPAEAQLAAQAQGGHAQSLQHLFDQHYPLLDLAKGESDFALASSVSHWCDDLLYGFEFGHFGCAPNITAMNMTFGPPATEHASSQAER